MIFIVFTILFFIFLFLFISKLLDNYGNSVIVFIVFFSIMFGLLLWEHTEYAGESYPYSEIHFTDNKGNVKEILKMKDGEIVERIIIEEQ